ncbi:YciI family protein [Nocardia sp. NPDC056611]|uniref:YciI family protein n=1 Tax=unclassified Nocardia TaxID=2637762 RepID=UPI00366ED988
MLLKFSAKKADAPQHLPGHQQWIQQGFDDEVFLLVGSIKPGVGGAVLAHNTSAEDLQRRVAQDPFVAADVVTADIVEIAAGQADDRLKFLLD